MVVSLLIRGNRVVYIILLIERKPHQYSEASIALKQNHLNPFFRVIGKAVPLPKPETFLPSVPKIPTKKSGKLFRATKMKSAASSASSTISVMTLRDDDDVADVNGDQDEEVMTVLDHELSSNYRLIGRTVL